MPVEFIADEPDEPAEADDASTPPPPGRSTLYRFVAGALVLAAVIVWVLTRPSGQPTSSVAQSAPPSSLVPRTTTASSPGPNSLFCDTDAPAPIAIAGAMKRQLHSLDLATLKVERCTSGGTMDGRTVFEAVSGRYHRLNIDVEAALPTDGPQAVSPRLGADHGRYALVARIQAIGAGVKVAVSAWGEPGARAPIDAMRHLADFVSLNVVL